MFIDESGEANITNPDPRFNVFVLCGVVFSEDGYKHFDAEVKKLKNKFFGNEDIIFHSFEMRGKKDAFKIFQDPTIMKDFYNDIGSIFKTCEYWVISCVVNKQKYKEIYPYKNHAYEDALTFLCERGISLLGKKNKQHVLHLCLEKRGKCKDSQLKKYYTNFIKYGTEYISTDEFKMCYPRLHFRGKDENTNGLQFADLIAYPIARKQLSPNLPQPTFDIFDEKFYSRGGRGNEYYGLGLKHFP
ncbi:DUF3800 domain-containing protein [Flavipsychrobacter stenotrophus]|nr:DUF3800 domain-containing protein [Flavipsychrobacter stenotrophus]